MGYRLSRIATRTGDNGTTGLGDGSRVRKDDPRIAALGDVDELNAQLGLLLCETLPDDVRAALTAIQHDLFDLGGELCMPGHTIVTDAHLARLDGWLEHYNATLPPLAEFILPGGSRAAALAHVCRTVCRRAERSVVALGAMGASDAAGGSGQSGASGASGPSGASGASGPSGASGASGPSGASGASGASDTSDVSGASGASSVDTPRRYMNRLSDLLFVLARVLNRADGGSDVLWRHERGAQKR